MSRPARPIFRNLAWVAIQLPIGRQERYSISAPTLAPYSVAELEQRGVEFRSAAWAGNGHKEPRHNKLANLGGTPRTK